MLTAPDVVIVGAGVIGLMTARELLREGVRVTVVDAGQPGAESSWAGGGIVSPLFPWRYPAPVTALADWAQAVYPGLCEDLYDAIGIDCEWRPSGLLLQDLPDESEALSWAQSQRKVAEVVDVSRLAQIQPGISETASALFFPGVAQVRNPRLVKALAADVQRRGGRLLTGSRVTALRHSQGRVTGVETEGGPIDSGAVVVCAGAWTARVLAETGRGLPIKPMRGQMLLFAPHAHGLRRIVLREGRYLIPRRDGRILCGSTLEDVGFDKSTTELAYESLRGSAMAMMPALAAHPVERHWAGLRPGSPDGIPSISAIPERPGLYVNAGHFRNGVVLAPASARLMADLLMRRPPTVDASPYALR